MSKFKDFKLRMTDGKNYTVPQEGMILWCFEREETVNIQVEKRVLNKTTKKEERVIAEEPQTKVVETMSPLNYQQKGFVDPDGEDTFTTEEINTFVNLNAKFQYNTRKQNDAKKANAAIPGIMPGFPTLD